MVSVIAANVIAWAAIGVILVGFKISFSLLFASSFAEVGACSIFMGKRTSPTTTLVTQLDGFAEEAERFRLAGVC